MKKAILLILALVLVLSLAACGEKDTGGGNNTTPPASTDNNTPSSTPAESATDSKPEPPAADTETLAGCLAQFGLTEADITPDNLAEIKPTALNKEFFRTDIAVNAMPESATIRAFVEQVYNSTKNVADDGKIYVSQDKNDLFNTRPMIEFTLDEADFSTTGKCRWGYDYKGTRYYVSITFEYKSREVTAYNMQIKYDWY